MARPRLYDHDEARRLYAEGWTKAELVRKYGVSSVTLAYVVDPEVLARHQARWNEILRATCEDCGCEVTKNWYSKHTRLDRVVCLKCSHRRTREDYLLTRLNEASEIHCVTCGQHRLIEEYRIIDGYPFKRCRDCETANRREWRERNRDRENAWQREFKRKRRKARA